MFEDSGFEGIGIGVDGGWRGHDLSVEVSTSGFLNSPKKNINSERKSIDILKCVTVLIILGEDIYTPGTSGFHLENTEMILGFWDFFNRLTNLIFFRVL